ncbi:MDR family MFS transporter [Pseudolysinimonas yzui]|uniref:MFS transporter n=1 Tax=Pseudolysinimonas yzui TaxID=2708254 RepID=A0A8J3GSS0_9MICO|nr:MDR family MFS transporter [Pseudolysinimonas yzui]GHF26916.1 MFS transporter [Pseudolysinimonas yzui]
MSSQTVAPPAQPLLTHRQILFIIFGLMAGMFLSSLDQTIVGTSIRTIADDLDGLALQASVTTAYLITSTVTTPIYGKLSDIFGRRPLFLFAISVFLLGSLLAGTAQSMYELAGFRALQGIGAGGLMALPLAILGDILAPRQRAKYQGYFLAVFATSSVLGPLIGGLFAGTPEILFVAGWRWVFLVNIPVGAIALFLVIRFLHVPHTRHRVKIDWWGATTIVVALVPLLLVAENGRDWGWGSPLAIGGYALGALGLIAFVLVERAMGEAALIPLKLFRHPTFSMVTVLGVLMGFGMFGAMMTLPLYLQLVNGATPTESGFLLLPMIVGLMISSIVSGQIIARTGRYRVFPTIGTGFMAAGFLWFTFAHADRPVWFMMIGMLLIGLGMGQLMQTLTIASQNSVGPREIGVATSSSTFFRQIGGTLGVAILFSVLFTRIPDTIQAAFGRTDVLRAALDAALDPTVASAPQNARIMDQVYDGIVDPVIQQLPADVDLADDQVRSGVLDTLVPQVQDALAGAAGGPVGASLDGDTSFLTGADPRLSAPFLEGFASAATTVYAVCLAVVLVAFVLSFFLKAPPLRTKSAIEEVADADAAIAAQLVADAPPEAPRPATETKPIPVR